MIALKAHMRNSRLVVDEPVALIEGAEVSIYLYDASIEVHFDEETAWVSLGQPTERFQRDKAVISRHIANVFEGARACDSRSAVRL